jgi:phospholipid/cholesterol/gamma-HCH transport system substrate-binding protein
MRLGRGTVRKRPNLERRYRQAAVLAALGLTLGTAFVFARQSLFGGGYQIRAVFSSVNQLRGGSEVRIAGIKVGHVDGISAGPDSTSIVELGIDNNGRPIHADATLTVTPRLVLEGNAYIDLNPGTPAAPELRSGAMIPLTRTAVSVQLDQVLDVLDTPTRGALQRTIAGLADGLGPAGTPASTASQSGYGGLRSAVRELDGAMTSVAQVAHAARGTQPGDLGAAIGSSGAVTAQLAHDPQAVADSVTGFNHVMAALAAEDQPLAASISRFDDLLTVAPASLTRIDAALPPLTNFADALRPAMHAAPVTLQKTNRLLDQIGAVVQPAELPRLLDRLAPVTTALPQLEQRVQTLFGYTSQVTDCISTHVVPVLDSKIQDGTNTTGDPAWLDLLHAVTGFTSASTSFDGNAGTFRAGLAFGAAALQGVIPGFGNIVGLLDPGVQGVRPIWLGYGVEPAYRPDQPCAAQPLPNLNAESGPAPSWDLHAVTSTKATGRR